VRVCSGAEKGFNASLFIASLALAPDAPINEIVASKIHKLIKIPALMCMGGVIKANAECELINLPSRSMFNT
jgi:hypothetical protein